MIRRQAESAIDGGFAVAMLGARMHYAVPLELFRRGRLRLLFTDFFLPWRWSLWGTRALRHSPVSVVPRMVSRSAPLPLDRVRANYWLGLRYWWALRRVRSDEEHIAAYVAYAEKFLHWASRGWSGEGQGVYVFNTAGLELLEMAARSGKVGVLEQTSASHEVEVTLIQQAAARYPGWGTPPAIGPERAAYMAREREEWQRASCIVCPSGFVKRSLTECGVPEDKLATVPYGVTVGAPRGVGLARRRRRPPRALFVGHVSLRKGAPLLYEAARRLKGAPVEFRAVGRLAVTEYGQRRLADFVDLIGPVARPRVWDEYLAADLFVFPSFCEGSATVVYEALAAGLPVVTTRNAGSVVRDGVDGFVVEAGDEGLFVERIREIAENDELREWMAGNALARALEFTQERYGDRLIAALSRCTGDRCS